MAQTKSSALLLLGTLLCLLAKSECAKRCVAMSGYNCSDLKKLGTRCYYNFNGQEDKCRTGDYITTIGGWEDIKKVKKWSKVSILQGPNEPNIRKAVLRYVNEMSPKAACDLYKAAVKKAPKNAIKLSPGVANCKNVAGSSSKFYYNGCKANHIRWLKDFFKAGCGKLVQAISAHVYDCDIQRVKSYVKELKTLGKKVWLTEIACQAPKATDSGNLKLLKALKQNSVGVDRWYWVQPRSTGGVSKVSHLVDGSGKLNVRGRTFRG